jgi:hypothetical protein
MLLGEAHGFSWLDGRLSTEAVPGQARTGGIRLHGQQARENPVDAGGIFRWVIVSQPFHAPSVESRPN